MSKTIAAFLCACVLSVSSACAQVLPLLGNFKGLTFSGTVDVSWPVLFEDCTFVTDSVVLRHSYGVLFRNCRFESRTGVLYMAGGGDGMILADCDVTGCSELRFSMKETAADRNYVTEVRVNADECTVLDDQESIIEIDGLELDDCVRGDLGGPLILIMSADRTTLKAGETATLRLRGLKDGMFAGWTVSEPAARLTVDGAFICRVTAPEQIDGKRTMVVSAYTEYGLEAACVITLDSGKTITENNSRKKRK
ncbi:MAG: hypothetical protein J6V95_06565 [Bacteroidaceae bacterium]|nr:hypothetical protein [Bacteroidaceae bacterium]